MTRSDRHPRNGKATPRARGYKHAHDRFASLENYAAYEYEVSRAVLIPLLVAWGVELRERSVLDIGSSGGGACFAMEEQGAKCTGVEIRCEAVQLAKDLASERQSNAAFVVGDAKRLDEVLHDRFDLITMHDVIEHVDDVRQVLCQAADRLTPSGLIFVTFPPYRSAFGGHQQATSSPLKFVPYIHLLPNPVLRALPVDHRLLEKLNKLSIATFEREAATSGLAVKRRQLFLTRPEFRYRFGIPVLRARIVGAVPFMRDFFVTGAFYLLSLSSDSRR